ncbi:MAG: hypothetical protein ACI9UH_000332 [Gammaproteobacteria bacterium]|jgi:hypothetical protein
MQIHEPNLLSEYKYKHKYQMLNEMRMMMDAKNWSVA